MINFKQSPLESMELKYLLSMRYLAEQNAMLNVILLKNELWVLVSLNVVGT